MGERFYSRSENSRGEKELVKDHLNRVGELCGGFLEPIGYDDWGIMLGRLHDFGKISESFQNVLNHTEERVNHALSGAVIATSFYSNATGAMTRKAEMFASVIAGHHSGIQNRSEIKNLCSDNLKGNESGRFDSDGRKAALFGALEYSNALSRWNDMTKREKTKHSPEFSKLIYGDISEMLFRRVLFSALVDADRLSAAEHEDPDSVERCSGNAFDAASSMKNLSELLAEKRSQSKAADKINKLRNELFDECLRCGENPPGLYTLTAPTGLGKTLSLFAFAAKQCEKYNKRRIIIVLPYLSVIEQNSKDYRKLVPDLLEIHSNYDRTDEEGRLAERWDAPLIITTNVSFFEPLFSDRPGVCRHLHQIANSVIVLDEAQSLPENVLDSTLKAITALCSEYKCTFVMSTATQPSFFLRKALNGAWNPTEIVTDKEKLYECTRRVEPSFRGKMTFDAVICELSQYEQFCVIVNMKKHALQLYSLLSENGNDDVFFITTDLCPAHRTAVLDEIRDQLDCGMPCKIIATQCIEAGVDLDVPVMWRALAPLEALIQSAGRCNRNGRFRNGSFTVFEPDTEGNIYPTDDYGRAANCVKTMLQNHPIELSDLSHINEYYQRLYQGSRGDSEKLLAAIEERDYHAVDKEYKIIDKQGVNIIVPYEGEMELYDSIRDELDRNGLTNALIRRASRITVSSYFYKDVNNCCEALYPRKHARNDNDGHSCYYLLGDSRYYSNKTGFDPKADFIGII